MELKEKICLALATRLAHCTNELITVLNSSDRVIISQYEIYSRKHSWNYPVAKALASAFAKISSEPIDVDMITYWSKFTRLELIQILKACTLHNIDFSPEETNIIIDRITGFLDKVDLGDNTPIELSNISIVE